MQCKGDLREFLFLNVISKMYPESYPPKSARNRLRLTRSQAILLSAAKAMVIAYGVAGTQNSANRARITALAPELYWERW